MFRVRLLAIGLIAGLLLSFAVPGRLDPQGSLSQLGPEHQLLAKMAGSFELDLTLWPATRGDRPLPGREPSEPMRVDGKSEQSLILGGRFLLSHFFTGPSRAQTEGYSIMGFDRKSKKYTLVSLDTNGTAMNYYEGAPSEEDGPLVLTDSHGLTQLTLKLNEDGSIQNSLDLLVGDQFQVFTLISTPVKTEQG